MNTSLSRDQPVSNLGALRAGPRAIVPWAARCLMSAATVASWASVPSSSALRSIWRFPDSCCDAALRCRGAPRIPSPTSDMTKICSACPTTLRSSRHRAGCPATKSAKPAASTTQEWWPRSRSEAAPTSFLLYWRRASVTAWLARSPWTTTVILREKSGFQSAPRAATMRSQSSRRVQAIADHCRFAPFPLGSPERTSTTPQHGVAEQLTAPRNSEATLVMAKAPWNPARRYRGSGEGTR